MSKKIIVDILLGILMILEFSRIYLDPAIHEIMGMSLVVLLIIHLLLNRRYLKAIPKGKYNLELLRCFRRRGFANQKNLILFLDILLRRRPDDF